MSWLAVPGLVPLHQLPRPGCSGLGCSDYIHSFFDILDPSFIRCVIFLRWWAPRVLCVLFQHVTLWHQLYTALLVSVVLGQGLQAVFHAIFMSRWQCMPNAARWEKQWYCSLSLLGRVFFFFFGTAKNKRKKGYLLVVPGIRRDSIWVCLYVEGWALGRGSSVYGCEHARDPRWLVRAQWHGDPQGSHRTSCHTKCSFCETFIFKHPKSPSKGISKKLDNLKLCHRVNVDS